MILLSFIKQRRASGLLVIGLVVVFYTLWPERTKWRYTNPLPAEQLYTAITCLSNGDIFWVLNNKSYIYDPYRNVSKEVAPYKPDLYYPRMYALPNNRVMLMENGSYDMYDLSSDAWTYHSFPVPNINFTAGCVVGNLFIALGPSVNTPPKLGEIIDLQSEKATPFVGTDNGYAVKISDNEILSLGFHPPEILNVKTLTWSSCKSPPFKWKQIFFETRVDEDRILCGVDIDGNDECSVIYNTKSDNWIRVPHHHHGLLGLMYSLRNGKVLSVGGYTRERSWSEFYHDMSYGMHNGFGKMPDSSHEVFLTHCQIFDPETSLWHYTYPLNTGRRLPFCTELPDGRFLVVGGEVNGQALTSCEVIDEKDLR